MDFQPIHADLERMEYELGKFNEMLMDMRINGDKIPEELTTNVTIAHQSVYIARIAFKAAKNRYLEIAPLSSESRAVETKEDKS